MKLQHYSGLFSKYDTLIIVKVRYMAFLLQLFLPNIILNFLNFQDFIVRGGRKFPLYR